MRRAAAHPVAELLRAEPRVRPFFAAQAQSALGTGAACVALLVLAHDRLNSPWAITLILLADLAPSRASVRSSRRTGPGSG